MRKLIIGWVTCCAVLGGPWAWGDVSSTTVTAGESHPVHKVILAVLSQNADRAGKVESRLVDKFADREVYASTLHRLFAPTVPVATMMDQIRAKGYDSVICISPRKSIQFIAPASTSTASGLLGCLSLYASGVYPGGDALDLMPQVPNTPLAMAGSSAVSRPQIVKGTIQVFDVTSGNLVWTSDVQAKFPVDMRTDRQIDVIAKEIWKVLAKANLFPIP